MTPALQAILASVLSSILGLAGGFFLLWKDRATRKFSGLFVSFAAGALLGAAFFDLLTEAVHDAPEKITSTFAWVVGGFLFFFLIEKLLLWHHHSHAEEHHAEHQSVLAPLILIGDGIHNFIDGTIIAATYLVSPALGTTTALAVFFHELPQEIGDFSIMLHAGWSRKNVALWNFLGALVSPFGAGVTILVSQHIQGLILPLIGIAAGNFIYISAADLIPEIHREKRVGRMALQFSLLVLGILTIVGFGKLFPGA
ncbi:MAG: ZIP family metal transporter [Patescibacteria group bacterium]